jgi:hypothetical protein
LRAFAGSGRSEQKYGAVFHINFSFRILNRTI